MSSETYGNSCYNPNKVMTCVENHSCVHLPVTDMVIYSQSHNMSNQASGSKHATGNSKLQKRRTIIQDKSGNLSRISTIAVNVMYDDASVQIQEMYFPYPSALFIGRYDPIRSSYYIPTPNTKYEYQQKLKDKLHIKLLHVLSDPMVGFVHNLTNVLKQREKSCDKSYSQHRNLKGSVKHKVCEDAFAQVRPICVVVYATDGGVKSDDLCHKCCADNKKAIGTGEIIDYLSLTQGTAQPLFRLSFKLPLLTVDSNERFVIFGFSDRLIIFSAFTLQPMLTLHNRHPSPSRINSHTSAPCECGNKIQKVGAGSKQRCNPFALKHGSWLAITETHLNPQLESGSNHLNTLGLRSGYVLGCANAQPVDQQCSSTIYKAAKGVTRALTNLSETAYGLASSSRCLLDSVLTDKGAMGHPIKTSSPSENQRVHEAPSVNVITVINLNDMLSSYQGFHYTTNISYSKVDTDMHGVGGHCEEWSDFCISPTDANVKCETILNKLGHNANAVGPLILYHFPKRVSISSPHKLVQNFLNVSSHLPLNRTSVVCHFKGIGGPVALTSYNPNPPLNLQPSNDGNGPKVGQSDALKYNEGDPENIIYMQFNPEGTLLFVAGDKGREFQLFYIGPHACNDPTLARVVHLYRLHRGLSPCRDLRLVDFSDDSRWLSVTTENDTTHLYAINSYGGGGGSAKFETHGLPKVFNEGAGDFVRSAGLDNVPLNINALQSKGQTVSSQRRLNRSSRLYKAVMAVPISRMPGSFPHKIQAIERLKSNSNLGKANLVKGSIGLGCVSSAQPSSHYTCTETNYPPCSQTGGFAGLTRAGIDFGLSALNMNCIEKRDVSALFAPSIYHYGRDGHEMVPATLPDLIFNSNDYSTSDNTKEEATSLNNERYVEWMGLDASEFEEPGQRLPPTPDQTNLLGTQDLDLKSLKEYLIYCPNRNLLTLRCSPPCNSRRFIPKITAPSLGKLTSNTDTISNSLINNSLYLFDALALSLSEYVLEMEPLKAVSNVSTNDIPPRSSQQDPHQTLKLNNYPSEGIMAFVQPLSTCSLLQSVTTSTHRKNTTIAPHFKLTLKREWSFSTDHVPAPPTCYGRDESSFETDKDMIIVDANFDSGKSRSKDSFRLIKSTPPTGSSRPSVKSHVGVSFLTKWSTASPSSCDDNVKGIFVEDKTEGIMDSSQWMSEVEVRTYAGPHRRVWMGPQFAFKTFQPHCHTTILQAQSPALLSAAKIKGDQSCELPNKVKLCPEFRNLSKTDEPFDLLTFCDEDTGQGASANATSCIKRDNPELVVLQALTDVDVDNIIKGKETGGQSLTDDLFQAINEDLLKCDEPAKYKPKAKTRVEPNVAHNLMNNLPLSVNSKLGMPLENILAEATDDHK